MSLLFLVVIFIFSYTNAYALTLDKTTYISGEPVTLIDGGGPYIIFQLNDGAPVGGDYSYTPGLILNPGGYFTRGDYAIVEFSFLGMPCFENSLSYNECKQAPEFVSETLFSVMPASWGTGGGVDEGDPPAPSIPSFRPRVEIKSPRRDGIYSRLIPVIYTAIDDNDNYSDVSRERYGFIDKPVSIYYTDKYTQFADQLSSDDSYKTLIAKDLIANGTYTWDASILSEQKFYQIIVRAIDKIGEIGQEITGLFTVDFTPPTFTLDVTPKVAKNEKVTIHIKSSEDLVSAPRVSVKQRGGKDIELKVEGKGDSYVATYNTITGSDGTAVISVIGTDYAGNDGSTIMSGGSFNVGINPPQMPSITYPNSNEKVRSERIDIIGVAREDTVVEATINGVDHYKAYPNEKGEFTIKNVSLKKNTTNGLNIINITSKDPLGSISEGAVINILYNAEPQISLVSPKPLDIMTGMNTIISQASDGNGDKLYFKYEIASNKKNKNDEYTWQLIEEVPSDKINFDSTKFPDGSYLIRASADDGVSTTSSSVVNINIRNESSFYIRFYDGLRIVVKSSQALVRGVVFAQKGITPAPTIKSLEYSIDNGAKWIKVQPQDGSFDSNEERFSVVISNLKQGLNNTLWRTKDSRGMVVNSDQPIISDSMPPKPPVILSPIDGVVLTKYDNDLTEKDKFNFTIRGTSEPRSIVNLSIDNNKFSSTTSFDGTFRIPNVHLAAHGKYTLNMYTTDEAQNDSARITSTVLYDNPPKIAFISPRHGKGINKDDTISWIIDDPDGDNITNQSLSYRKLGGEFITIVKNIKGNSFKWDSHKLASGTSYEIRLQASDGFITTSETVPFVVDHDIPKISDFHLVSSYIKKDGLLVAAGKAEDMDGGVEFIEYSFSAINNNNSSETKWFKANIDNKLAKKVNFSIKSHIDLPDGEYQILLRAVDSSGNYSDKIYKNFNVNTKPPRIGAVDISVGDKKLSQKDGVLEVVAGTNISLKISLEKDTKIASIDLNGVETPLVRDLATGLWASNLLLDKAGEYHLSIQATDIYGNSYKNDDYLTIKVTEKAKIVYINESGIKEPLRGVTITANYVEKNSSFWSLFSQNKKIVVTTNESGEYDLLLPEGSYRVILTMEGFENLILGEFTYDTNTFFNNQATLKKTKAKNTFWSKLYNMLKL